MKISDLPFLHFLVRSVADSQSVLLSPRETQEEGSGSLYAPVQEDRTLFPAYRFHFSVYLGDGLFVEDMQGDRALFTGIAKAEGGDHLTLVFGVPGPAPWKLFPHFFPAVPRLLGHEDQFYIPTLRRVPRKRPARYGGRFEHPDLRQMLVELQPDDPSVLDELLLRFGISLIGCDSGTKYKSRRVSKAREPVA